MDGERGKNLTFKHRVLQAGRHFSTLCSLNLNMVPRTLSKEAKATRSYLKIAQRCWARNKNTQPGSPATSKALKDAVSPSLTPLPQSLWAETMPSSRKEAGNKNSSRTSYPSFPTHTKMQPTPSSRPAMGPRDPGCSSGARVSGFS